MKVLILNSGMGKRMGELVLEHPKCMTAVTNGETILGRQLRQIKEAGIEEVIITTGYLSNVLMDYCRNLQIALNVTFVDNPIYEKTNYIYSIYCARKYLDDDLILMHGDVLFENAVLDMVINSNKSCMALSTTKPLPEKDFKAVVDNGRIVKIGIDLFENSVSAQPLFKLFKRDLDVWLDKIVAFCEEGKVTCYAENALNEVTSICELYPLNIKGLLCNEIDNLQDLETVPDCLADVENRTVYLCFSTDILHSGHMTLIKKAQRLGKLIIGVLSDEVVAGYKRFPLMPFIERKSMFENIVGVTQVVEQRTLSYKDNLEKIKPSFVVHGTDWLEGFQRPIRDEVATILAGYGGILVEYPYLVNQRYAELEKRASMEISLPELRRSRLKKLMTMKGIVTAIEAHSGLTGLIAEKTVVYQHGGARQFDAMWISSLCDSTARGKPDIELVDMSSRFRTVEEIMEVTTKPIIFDGDTGGLAEHFVYTVRTLERMGVSMIIIEDKVGLKKNSLFGNEVTQVQDSIQGFCNKIRAGKNAQMTKDFMICARIESLILEQGMEDALRRAIAFVKAGADAIMIHSRKTEPDEIFEFLDKFRTMDDLTPVVVVPTSFNTVTEEEFKKHGVNIVIYAN